MKQLATLAKDYGDFYAPSYAVRLGQRDVMRDLLIPMSQVEVDLKLGGASRFQFTVPDCYDRERGLFRTGGGKSVLELLPLGARIEVRMGYGSALRTMVHGVITEIGTSFPEDGSPELSFSGYDNGFTLTLGRNSDSFKESRDSAAVEEIAKRNNLRADVQRTEARNDQIEQNNESDWAFLEKLAKRNHFEVFVDEKETLHFRKPDDDATAVIELIYGEGLLSFRPTANLAGQTSAVEVYGWDHKTKKAIVGKASAGQESGLSGKSAGQILDTFVHDPSRRPTLRLRQPVFTQAEANQRARAAQNERAKEFLTGEGETIGLPELRPNRSVKLSKLGELFSKPYYIQQATHTISASGYRTRFTVGEPGL